VRDHGAVTERRALTVHVSEVLDERLLPTRVELLELAQTEQPAAAVHDRAELARQRLRGRVEMRLHPGELGKLVRRARVAGEDGVGVLVRGVDRSARFRRLALARVLAQQLANALGVRARLVPIRRTHARALLLIRFRRPASRACAAPHAAGASRSPQ
jgi:hypothetical protein